MKTELEEAAEIYTVSCGFHKTDINNPMRLSFEIGAKWQQERMYSEEEVKKLIVDFLFMKGIGREVGSVNEWFENFKKK